uniref:Putative salivary kunitz domain protein n=1 Tax=Ixodes ricinus TaxID=34613 RepID=A0A6B0TZ15_IXORI
MRFSCILGLLAMCLLARADEPDCTRTWPVLWPPCLFICQHGSWGRHSWPRFTLEHKPNGTSCRAEEDPEHKRIFITHVTKLISKLS